VKSTFPLLALLAFVAFGFSACTTLANRRDLYSPTKANGPYTRSLQDGSWRDNGVKPVEEEYAKPHSSSTEDNPS
jgi:hypothetical protein